MPEPSISRAKKVGQAPGMLLYIGRQKTKEVKITIIDFDKDGEYLEKANATLEDLEMGKDSRTVTWVNVSGLQDTTLIGEIGRFFNVHPLLVEDILNTDQRPRLEPYDDFIFIVLKTLHWNAEKRGVEIEQVSLLVSGTYVLSFEEGEDDIFDPLRQRLKNEKGRLRTCGSDYLAYAILDTIVDNYFLILEMIGDQLDELEEKLIVNPTNDTLSIIQDLKRELLYMRKVVWPLREAIGRLSRGDVPFFDEDTLMYVRDVYEHTIQIIDSVETFRGIVSGMIDIYLSSLSNKMNEVMKVLTIIATIFIPISFLTSLYGMNLDMPEVKWPFAYPLLWIVILLTSGTLLLYFKRRNWL
ncbi:MAG: magnesium/cobalt transporter CorA [Candidatus Promineifilaceae bacterium]